MVWLYSDPTKNNKSNHKQFETNFCLHVHNFRDNNLQLDGSESIRPYRVPVLADEHMRIHKMLLKQIECREENYKLLNSSSERKNRLTLTFFKKNVDRLSVRLGLFHDIKVDILI